MASPRGAGAPFIHESAEVDPRARVGKRTKVWRNAQIREGARVGDDCIVAKDVYIGAGVRVGSRVKIENSALVFEGAVVADDVFIGPQACLANDRRPRSTKPGGRLRTAKDWKMERVRLERGSSVGAQAVLIPPLTVAPHAMIGAGSVVTKDVRAHELVAGSPAHHLGWVCECGERLRGEGAVRCRACGLRYTVSARGVRRTRA